MPSPFLSIKSNAQCVVKLRPSRAFLFALALIALSAAGVNAEEPDPFSTLSEPTAPPSESDEIQDLPDIEARAYDITIERRSASQKVYLMNDVSRAEPQEGKIFLLKRQGEPVMGFRVIKLYPEKSQFAAKQVRLYNEDTLEAGAGFRAVEKIADITPPPPTPQDNRDLQELESPPPEPPPPPPAENALVSEEPPLPPPPPDELAASETPSEQAPPEEPPPTEESAAEGPPVEESESDVPKRRLGSVVEEIQHLDPNDQSISFVFGYFQNVEIALSSDEESYTTSPVYFAGGGLRYSYTLRRMMWLTSANLQDSLAADFGAFTYKSITDLGTYNVFPLTGTLRYNLLMGETMTTFAYAGLVKNFVVTGADSNALEAEAMAGIVPAIGVGLAFRIGPSWDVRIDLGMDIVSVGLMLGF